MTRMVFSAALLIAAAAIALLFWPARHDRSSTDDRSAGEPRGGVPAEHRPEGAAHARPARSAPNAPTRNTASAPLLSSSPSASTPEPGTLPTDPEDPDYDPAVLMRALGMSPQVLFEREQRDPIWAPAVESRIRDTLRHDFSACFPNREPTVKQECRSSTCIVTLEMPKSYSEADKELADAIPKLAQLASGSRAEHSGNTVTYGMTIARDRRDLDRYDAQMKAGRRRFFDMLQQTPELPKTDPFAAALKDLKDCYARIWEMQ